MCRKTRSPLRSVGQVTAVTVGVIAYVSALLIGAFLIILASNMLLVGIEGTVPMDAMWCMFWLIQILCGLMLVLVGFYPISQWWSSRRRLRWQKPETTHDTWADPEGRRWQKPETTHDTWDSVPVRPKEPLVKLGQGSNERHLVEDD